MTNDKGSGEHNHQRERIEETGEQLPEHVVKLIALGEVLIHNQVIVVEEARLKGDELHDKGLDNELLYFEKRLLTTRGLLSDKGITSDDEFKRKLDELKGKLGSEITYGSFELGVEALTDLLLKKGVVTYHALDRKCREVKARTPMTGGKIVARAWVDPDFKARLKKDAKAAVMSMDTSLLAPNNGEPVEIWNVTQLEALENTEKNRNVVVCTLCSCYPRGLLGEPPEWYTSDSYKERIIKEPRKVLREMGMKINDDLEIRVYDSTADIRYMVIPLRPKGTEGLSEAELAKLVTRDSLIGVADPLAPIQK